MISLLSITDPKQESLISEIPFVALFAARAKTSEKLELEGQELMDAKIQAGES